MNFAGTLMATLLVGACLAAPASASARADLGAAGHGGDQGGQASLAPTSTSTVVVTLPDVTLTALVLGDVLSLPVTVDAPEATVIRFQTRPDATHDWVDALTEDAPAGPSDHAFTVPTSAVGGVDVRVVVDPTASDPVGFQSDGWSFTVAAPTVELSAVPTSTLTLGSRFVLRGAVTGTPGRAVRVELSTPAGWMPLAKAATDATGAYALSLPSDWYYRGRLRVVAPATSTSPTTASPAFSTSVVPTYDPLGSSSDWRLMVAGVRWDPCAGTIRYQVNRGGVSDRRLAQLRTALGQVHAATGLQFAYAGTTSAVPYRTDGAGPRRGTADFTIAFAGPRQVHAFTANVVGLGGFVWRGGSIVHGLVSLDRGARVADGFGTGQTWGSLMLHELGHAVGLDHAAGLEQVMHSGLNARSHGSYQQGDLAGLRRQSALGGCVAVPAARVGAAHVARSR